jgi:hypothetical protein
LEILAPPTLGVVNLPTVSHWYKASALVSVDAKRVVVVKRAFAFQQLRDARQIKRGWHFDHSMRLAVVRCGPTFELRGRSQLAARS